MTYKKDIELVFDAAAFLTKNQTISEPQNSRLDLWYIGASRQLNPLPLTPEKESFLQTLRDHIRGLSQAQTSIKDLLHIVSTSWNKAAAVVDNIRLLNISCPTIVTKISDSSILIKASLLISPLTSKVEITFQLNSTSSEEGFRVEILPSATVIYGERFNEAKMGEFLLNRVGVVVTELGESDKATWSSAVAELGEKLLARGRK